MNLVHEIRYVLALLAVVTLPPAFLHWYLLHPFVGTWRRLGARRAYTVFIGLMLAAAVGLFLLRDVLLAVEFGTRLPLIVIGLACYGGAVALELQVRKHLSFRILTGLPELAAEDAGRGELLTEGVYARVRHPRYLAVLLGTIGWAFIANYLAVYLLAALTPLALYGIVRLEERELLDRFGERYAAYRRRVPMLLPRPGDR